MANPTGSGIWRAANCPPSSALPQVQSTNPDATRGTVGHRFLELVPKVGEDQALAQVPEELRALCGQIDLEGLPLDPKVYRQEVAWGFNVRTGEVRALGTGLGRRYPDVGANWVFGTLDVVGFEGEDTVLITDYKFDGFDTSAPPPAENPQLKFGALCECRLTQRTRAVVRLIHIREDGTHWQEDAVLDAFDLDAFAFELLGIVVGIRKVEAEIGAGKLPSVNRGDWCRYCPAATHCPALLNVLRATAAEPEAILALQPIGGVISASVIAHALTPETAAKAYHRMRQVESALKMAKEALFLFASESPINVGEGVEYGLTRVADKSIDAAVVRRELLRLHGAEVAEAACEFDTSEAAIERSLRQVWEKQRKEYEEAKGRGEKPVRPTLAGLKKAALADIEKAGGIRRGSKVRVSEHQGRQAEVQKPPAKAA
jgi:hypothetical protein